VQPDAGAGAGALEGGADELAEERCGAHNSTTFGGMRCTTNSSTAAHPRARQPPANSPHTHGTATSRNNNS
jgi:hypothetical protein